MPIITISRGSASGGLLLAEGLAKKLGYGIVGREEIVHEAARFGISEKKLQEALFKPLSFWDRLKHDRRRYLALGQAALCERVQQDGIVYHGNAGHLLLHDVSHLLCIRLIAPLSFRIDMLRKKQGMSSDEAVAYIEKVDRQRREWTKLLYGVDWLDPNLYDLTINLKTLDIDGAVELAASAAQRDEFQATEVSRAAMANLLLVSKVQAALAINEQTASCELEVKAQDGEVFLRGKLRPASLVDAVIEVASGVEGVKRVDREELDAPDYTV